AHTRTIHFYSDGDSISAATPNNPVALTHASGHASFFNQKAMQMAGVDSKTKTPPGGEILKDAKGEPIGVFSETAAGLVSRARRSGGLRRSPDARRQKLRRQIDLAIEDCLRKGVTSFQDAGSGFATIDMFREMAERGELGVRLWVMIRAGNRDLERNLASYRMVNAGDHFLTVRAVKRSIDGALGSRGAWLLEPYTDEPGSSGLETATVASVTRMAELGARHGFQVCVHAIGDRANREVLDIFEKVWGQKRDGAKLRWRIEHAQHIHRDDIPRFGKLGVIASMQGVHCTSDAPYVLPRLGEQRGDRLTRSLIRTRAQVRAEGRGKAVVHGRTQDDLHAPRLASVADGSQVLRVGIEVELRVLVGQIIELRVLPGPGLRGHGSATGQRFLLEDLDQEPPRARPLHSLG
ncbi:MAG TPA: hypothetical protein EYP98_04665, partial [Planctomycetes bacterium]|nr:hypothetical protein [Planctomycetota bacterium]